MQFDIEFKVLNSFDTNHLLLVSNDLLHYLGIAISSCSGLCMIFDVSPEEVMEFKNPSCISPYLFY